jgi:hypothetical protein
MLKNESLNYSYSAPLVADVRKLPIKGQAEVLKKFKKLAGESPWGLPPGPLRARFEEYYNQIDFRHLEDSCEMLHYAVNDFDNWLYRMDMYAPTRFFDIAGGLAPVIAKWLKKV